MPENKDLRAAARAQLKGKWLKPVLVCLIYFAIVAIISSFAVNTDENYGRIGLINLISFLVSAPLSIGLMYYFLKFSRNEEPEVSALFDGFKSYISCLGLTLWVGLWTVLWSLLLIIPGIVKSFGYMMSYFIFADNRQIGIRNALNLSKKISYGYRGKLFLLYLSFIGWAILATIPLFIGWLWLMPYMYVSLANFYEELKKKSIEDGLCTPEDFQQGIIEASNY